MEGNPANSFGDTTGCQVGTICSFGKVIAGERAASHQASRGNLPDPWDPRGVPREVRRDAVDAVVESRGIL